MTSDVRTAAWSALAIALVADALLAPFYPQFFASTFGADGVVTTGLYIALCRIAVVLALPAWTRATRRIAPLRLVAAAQAVAATAALGCAVAPTLAWFLALTFVAEAARTAYLLLYPLLFATAPEERRGVLVAQVAAAFHAAALIAAFGGGLVLEHVGGRTVLVIAAAADLVQLGCLAGVLRGARPVPPPAIASATARPRASRSLIRICAVTFVATATIVILRPHFTLFVSEVVAPGAPLWLLGAVFVIPSAVAVALVPLGGRVLASRRRAGWLVVALLAMAVTALGQLGAATLALLVVARVVYGAASYLVDIAIDHAALGAQDTYAQFGVVGAVQNAAIVVAPLAAALLADRAGWTALFVAAAALAVAAAALVPRRSHD